MTRYEVLAGLAGLAIVAYLLFLAFSPKSADGPWAWLPWQAPAVLSLLFLCWSLYAVFAEGPLGFWFDHIRSAWGNQIWFDLLLAIGIAMTFMMPKAKALGMYVMFWVVFVLATGCIGLLATMARILYLEQRAR